MFSQNDKINNFNGHIFLEELSEQRRPNMAIFLSGGGSNAEKLLADRQVLECTNPVVLVTDAPEKSRARLIGEKYNLPVVEFSIREFYRSHGLPTTSLATEKGRQVRELWTGELRKKLAPYRIDFGVLAGFEPLSNITDDFPCLNVHPGDLSVVDSDGNRCYVGLHSRPVESAILAGEKSLRASVIIALSFNDAGKDMDNGILLGISQPMAIDFGDLTLDELKKIKSLRSGKKPAGGWKDALEELALRSQEQLKLCGDHIILPLIVRDFARRCFGWMDDKLYYRTSTEQPFSLAVSQEYDAAGHRNVK